MECEVRQYEIKDTEAEIKRFKDGVDAFVRETDELIEKLAAKLNGDDSNALVLKIRSIWQRTYSLYHRLKT